MEEADSSASRQQAFTPPKSPPPLSTNNIADAKTDGSGCSFNDSGPSTPVHEHPPSPVTAEDNGKAIQPYDIEEPDDEPEPAVQRLDLPRLPDNFERWQRELVDYMDGLGSQSNKTSISKGHASQKRGQKRKSTAPASSGNQHSSQPHRSKSRTRINESALHVPGLSSKRRRRRSKLPGENTRNARPVSLDDFREARCSGSSSSENPSTCASSTDTIDESAVADGMDID